MTYSFDSHSQKIKHLLYKNIIENTKFSSKKFQNARSSTTQKKVLESLDEIATCLNGISIRNIPKKNLQNVCFLVCNTYKNNDSLGVSPLNDCYLTAQLNHKRGYQIFYLYDSTREEFMKYISVFLKYTRKSLIIYYSGKCTTVNEDNITDSAIVFEDGYITGYELNGILSLESNKKHKIVLICDCFTGSSIWNLSFDKAQFPVFPSNVVSIYPVYNSNVQDVAKKAEELHGIFTYYLSKYSYEVTDISPSYLMQRMNSRFNQLDMSVIIESTKNTINSQPIFY